MELIRAFGIRDALEILILAFIIYRVLVLIQGTRAMQMILGLLGVVVLAFVSAKLGLHTINWIFSNFLTAILLTVVVLFQPELRRALAAIGRTPLSPGIYSVSRAQTLEELVRASVSLAGRRVGALITIQRETDLSNYVEGGTVLDARLSRELLVCIFLPNGPLHDGSVIIKDDRLITAGAFLPISLDPRISKDLGTRHRAALGIAEETDAVVVIVSEETGIISVAAGGELTRNLDAVSLREILVRHLSAGRNR